METGSGASAVPAQTTSGHEQATSGHGQAAVPGQPSPPERRRGRHRRPETAAEPAEPSGGPARHSRPEDTVPDPLADTGPIGLRMFNLGTIPASVTPPKTWRRAAWFTIGTSMAALAGLATLSAVLVAPARANRVDTEPYFPDGAPLAALGGPRHVTSQPHTAPGVPVAMPTTGPAVTAPNPPAAVPALDDIRSIPFSQARPAPTPEVVLTTSGSPVAGPASIVAPLPEVTPRTTTATSPAATTAAPLIDPNRLLGTARTFLSDVTNDVQAAADLTVGTAHDDAVALLDQKYGDLSTIQIKSISLDPTSGLTICLLRVVNKDGSTQTQRTTLKLTLTGDPKITNPGG